MRSFETWLDEPVSRWSGRTTPARATIVSPAVLRHVLSALGLPADTSRELSSSRRLLTKRSSLADLPPLVTAVAGRPTRLDVGGSEAQSAELVLESGDYPPLSRCCRRADDCACRQSPRLVTTDCASRTGKSCWRSRRRGAARSRTSFPTRDYGGWPRSSMA